MTELYNVDDECSQAWKICIDDTDERGLLDFETNHGVKYNGREMGPILEEEG